MSEQLFSRQFKHREFEVSEMSLRNHIMLTARGDSPFVAIAAFPSRFFRHGFLYVNVATGVSGPRTCERYPWLAASLYNAFLEAKEAFRRELVGTPTLGVQRTALPWLMADVQAAREAIGDDFWPYGIAANRRTLEAAVHFARDQGLIERPVTVEELFAPSTLLT